MQTRWVVPIGLLAAVALAVGGYLWLRRVQRPQAPPPAAAVAPSPADLSLSGKVRARHVIAIPAPIEGTLESLEVQDGQDVAEGQLLARIRNTSLDAQREQAELEAERLQSKVNDLDGALIAARLEASRARADATRARSVADASEKSFLRQKALFAEGATARLTFEKAESDARLNAKEADSLENVARQAEDRIGQAQRSLDDTRKGLNDATASLDEAKAVLLSTEIHTPVDGIVLSHKAGAGEEVNRNIKDLFQIAVDLTQLEVAVEPPPDQLKRVKAGMAAAVQVVEAGSEAFAGVVREIRGNEVVVDFQSPSPAVRPGLMAQVRIALEEAVSKTP